VPLGLANAGLGLLLGAILAVCGRPLRGTTLVGPWIWGVVSAVLLTCISLAHALEFFPDAATAALWQYAAEVSVLCPAVALMGARRPQHTAWQFVVATLYALLLVPAIQGMGSDGAVVIVAPWSWFLMALWGVGIVNLLPTRYWPATVVLGGGQAMLLAPYLAGDSAWAASQWRIAAGLGLLVVGVLLCRRRALGILQSAAWRRRDPLDRLWIDFRDAYGLLWGARVQQRVNAAAAQYDWPVMLSWDGFRDRAEYQAVGRLPAEVRAPVEHVMRTVLWRFMSPQWIEARLMPPREDES